MRLDIKRYRESRNRLQAVSQDIIPRTPKKKKKPIYFFLFTSEKTYVTLRLEEKKRGRKKSSNIWLKGYSWETFFGNPIIRDFFLTRMKFFHPISACYCHHFNTALPPSEGKRETDDLLRWWIQKGIHSQVVSVTFLYPLGMVAFILSSVLEWDHEVWLSKPWIPDQQGVLSFWAFSIPLRCHW